MNSRVRVFTIVAISVAVPVLAIWQRWSEISVFARDIQKALRQSADTGAGGTGGSSSATGNRTSGTSPAAALAAAGDWQGAIDQVLSLNSEPSVTGAQLLELLPVLPESGRAEAVQHLANLLPDEEYEPMSRMLANPETSEDIQDLLMVDLLNRRNGVKLPALLELARTPNHAKASTAKELLQPYLEEDFGDDWAKCQEKLNLWMKEHPDS